MSVGTINRGRVNTRGGIHIEIDLIIRPSTTLCVGDPGKKSWEGKNRGQRQNSRVFYESRLIEWIKFHGFDRFPGSMNAKGYSSVRCGMLHVTF